MYTPPLKNGPLSLHQLDQGEMLAHLKTLLFVELQMYEMLKECLLRFSNSHDLLKTGEPTLSRNWSLAICFLLCQESTMQTWTGNSDTE